MGQIVAEADALLAEGPVWEPIANAPSVTGMLRSEQSRRRSEAKVVRVGRSVARLGSEAQEGSVPLGGA